MGNSDAKSMKLTDVEANEKNCPAISEVSPEVRSSGQAVLGNQNWPTTIYGVGKTDPIGQSIRFKNIPLLNSTPQKRGCPFWTTSSLFITY